MAYDYPKLGVEEFGEHLLQTGDLDPVYIALVGAELEPDQLRRWLLAYWCFYNVGTASFLSERKGADFMDHLRVAAINEEPAPTGGRWPRGAERRHFRGMAARNAAWALYEKYGKFPEHMVDACCLDTCAEVIKKVKTHYLFGDWIGFKVADMLERVVGHPVSFDRAAVFMFKDPKEAAARLFVERNNLPHADPKKVKLSEEGLDSVLNFLARAFATHRAPPRRDRGLGLQEYETILCKFKSHLNGHYPLGKDSREIRVTLKEWAPYSETAERLLAHAPEVV